MKKSMVWALAAITLCTAFTPAVDPAKDILGKWKIDASSLDNMVSSIMRVTRESNPEAAEQLKGQEEMLKEMVTQITVEYKADNTYAISTPQGPQYGKWAISADQKNLLINRDGKPERKDAILIISPNRLQLVNPERRDTTLYIRP